MFRKANPAFVAAVPVYVEDVSDAETTDGEYDSAIKEPSQKDYQIAERRGQIVSHSMTMPSDSIPKHQLSSAPHRVSELANKISKEAFIGAEDVKPEESAALAAGFNKPRSMSTSRNRSLVHAVDTPLETTLSYRRFGFFWDFAWELHKDQKIYEATYDEVHRYYRHFKNYFIHHAKKTFEKYEKNPFVACQKLKEFFSDKISDKEIINSLKESMDKLKLDLEKKVTAFCKNYQALYQDLLRKKEITDSSFLSYTRQLLEKSEHSFLREPFDDYGGPFF